MTFWRIPILTLSVLVTMIGLHFQVADKTQVYFSATDILRGETWRLFSGHFIHVDLQHLLWNCLGFAVLGTLLEYRSRAVLTISLAIGILSVNALLLTPHAQLNYYCGLSGVLNTLLLVVLWIEWKMSRSWLIILVACGSIAKVVVEVSQGVSIMTDISWPPYAWSHMAGMAGGVFVIWLKPGIERRMEVRKRVQPLDTANRPPLSTKQFN